MSKLDPTDDKLYENLSLTEFLRHFVPQEQTHRQEVKEITEKGKLPFLDPNIPEKTSPKSRSERRQIELKKRKADKTKAKLEKKVANMLSKPEILRKAIETDPNIKNVAMKLIHK